MDQDNQLDAVVRRCQGGEQTAFEELFRLFQPRLRYYVRRLDCVGDSTDDVLQEVWVKVVRNVHTLRDRRAFTAWLYRIARNEIYGQGRARDPFVELADEHLELPGDESEPAFSTEDVGRLHQGLSRLKAHHREVLTLYFLEELPQGQIAEILGVQPNTVRTRIYYAKQALRKEMEKSHE
jgi:RNA polymerase sigma-70 factor, ECF subfamily